MHKLLPTAAFLAVSFLAALHPAQAGVTQVFTRSALPSTTFDWSAFGPPGTGISTPEFQSNGTVTVGVASSSGSMLIRQEGTDFIGNFAPGDNLLSLADDDRSDTFIVSFPSTGHSKVVGLGAQIQPVSGFTGLFTGILDLYSASNALLGEVTVNGDSTTAEDNSAVFLGAISSTPINYAMFWVATGFPGFPREGDLAINDLSLLIQEGVVPEPASILVMGTALVGLAALRRRNRAN